jgi:hypothetical protein
MRLPIGIQDFTNLRENNYLYVDKTMHFLPFIQGGRYFLSRPRRFGKSLLLSTLKAAFSGRKDLFNGLWLEHHFDFTVRPVIRLDFSNINFTSKPLDQGIVDWLRINALEYNYELQSINARDALRELILEFSKTNQVVILIDEYDKPITDYLLEPLKRTEHQAILKSVYGVLKPLDAHLHLVVLTGVSKIGKLSLFSDLNNLQDISLNPKYAIACGYTEPEIRLVFADRLKAIAFDKNIELEAFMSLIRHWYNGYSWDAIQKVFCPFSFLLFLEQPNFRSYWYETGTPTFLLELIRAAQINPFVFEHLVLPDQALVATDVERIDPLGLMFQTGYLTIQKIESDVLGTRYTLSYPNEEVRQAFSSSLLAEYSQSVPSFIGGFSLELQRALAELDWNTFFASVNRVLAGIPYEIFPKREDYIHSLVHLMLIGTGYRTQSQVQTATGRIDTLLETLTHSIIFEFKIKGTAKSALKQIETVGYASSFSKPVVKVGVRFDLEKKLITQWAVD